jgi:glycosyltransferase involved in cell wall biosynthesis
VADGLVVYRASHGIDAIDEYSRRLVDALRAGGGDARYVADGLSPTRPAARTAPWVLLQYNPFGYGRAGFAPWLIRDAVVLRRRYRVPLALMVHEAWIDISDARSLVIGAYQRLQLRALLRLADVVLASTEALVEDLGDRAIHAPVASNITPVAIPAAAARARLGLPDGALVIALFGRGHPTRALGHAEAAIVGLAGAHGPERVTVLNLGAGAPPIAVPVGVDVQSPGRLDADEVSLRLRASDMMLLPLVDGLSTRRTTLMAALAHGVPLFGLRGAKTDRVLVDHPQAVSLTPVHDVGGYVRAAVALAADRERLRRLGESGRRLYVEQFDWPVAARRVRTALERL